MRRAANVAWLVLALWPLREAGASCVQTGADANASGNVDVVDVQCVILGALWALGPPKTALPGCMHAGWGPADVDCSDAMNVVDAQLAVVDALDGGWNPALDGDGDGCLDSCQPSCCAAHPGGGCARQACTQCVCERDPACCDIGWDDLCALEQTRMCSEFCHCIPVGAKACCAAHHGASCDDSDCAWVSGGDPVCGKLHWDNACVLHASTLFAAECGCSSPPGDCCEPHYGPGCATPACQSCVCATDAYCCSFLWDEACTASAKLACGASCGCGPVPKGPCCAPHLGMGCDVPACESCVCAADPSCCSTRWDGICAGLLASECQASCGCMTEQGAGACTAFHEGTGCEDATCAACVCASDPWCCRKRWDRACVARALGPCGASCGP